jgi:hypothetical protein
MLKLRIKLIEVNYDQIVERFLPEALEGSMESRSLSLRLAGKLLVKDGEASALAKGVLRLIPQQAMGSVAYQLVLRNQERIKETLKQYLIRELPGLFLKEFHIIDTDKAVFDVIKLEVVLEEIDYNTVLRQLVMKLLNNLSQKPDKTGRLAQVLLSLGDAPGEMITAAFALLSQEQKDRLLVELFANYQEEVIESLNHGLEQQGISAKLAKLKVIKE